MVAPKTELLADSSDAEGLARKSCRQQVVRWKTVNIPYVSALRLGEVSGVRCPGESIDLDRVHAIAAERLERVPEPADAGKQVDKPKGVPSLRTRYGDRHVHRPNMLT